MKYLVMECALGYAVVLDSRGRFIKVPNMGYEVGQVLDFVIIPKQLNRCQLFLQSISGWIFLHTRIENAGSLNRSFAKLSAAAACIFIFLIGGWYFWISPIGEIRIQINPDVQITVNRMDRVIAITGENEDGEKLIENYRSYGKTIETVSDELADLAMEMGYLSEGGEITLTVTSENKEWKTAAEDLLLLELETHLDSRVVIIIYDETEEYKSEVPTAAPTADTADSTVTPTEPPNVIPENAESDDDTDEYYDDDDEDEDEDDEDEDDDDD